jgi:hypothetical protein
MGWSRVRVVKVERGYHARIDTAEKHVGGIVYEHIDFLQLVHTREAGRRKVLVKILIWGCIANVCLDNTDRAVCCHRSGVRRGCACSVASKHIIVVRYRVQEWRW